MAGGLSPC
ncbi:hypothetical protein YPPY59_4543, partial [Yersinia pestis PY-59]